MEFCFASNFNFRAVSSFSARIYLRAKEKNEFALEGKSWMESRLIDGFVFVPVTSHSEKASLGTAAVSVTKFQSSFLIFTFFRSYFGQTNGNRDTLAWNFIYICIYRESFLIEFISFEFFFFGNRKEFRSSM